MKNTFILLFLLSFSFSLAQGNILDVEIIKANGENLKAKTSVSYEYNDGEFVMDEESFYKKITVVDDLGKKLYVLPAKEIRKVTFINPKGKNRIFLKDFTKNQFMELFYNGKIKCYRQYVPSTHYMGIYYYWVQPDGKPFKVGPFENNIKILKRITASKPELAYRIETHKTDGQLISILEDFEKQ